VDKKEVWSVTIDGKNDCVVLDEFEAMQVKIKFSPDVEMYNMTKRFGMQPEHLHKEERMQYYPQEHDNWIWSGPLPQPPYKKGQGPGMYGGAAKMVWEYEDLMAM
tara:strand:+ start:24 stop:338 length:315 start_codon:yes stop_codon:yes gene_type:complete